MREGILLKAYFLDTPVGKHFLFFGIPPFHPSVLKPDFDLTVGEVEHARQLQTLLFVDVHAEEELPLQLPDLVLGVGAALFAGALATCRGRSRE